MAGVQTKINNLQALRAFAALAVVIFHTGYVVPHAKPIGSFGVEVFFALSGYIMARICETNPRYFLRRRLIRIVPPYWLFTVLLFLAALRFPALMGSTSASYGQLLKSLFFIPFFKSPGIVRPLLFVGWSLNYEMFFYLLIALSLALVPRRPLLLPSVVIVAVHAAALLFGRGGAWTTFFSEGFVLDFPLGVLAYHAAKRVSAASAERWRAGSLLLLLAAVAALAYMQGVRPAMPHIAEAGVYSVLSTLTVLSASLLSQGGWDTRWTPLILVGDASYVLYLIHPYCEYALQRILVPHLPALRIDWPPGCILAVSLSVAAGLLLHLYAEDPVLEYLNRRFGGHRKSVEFRVVAEPRGQVNP